MSPFLPNGFRIAIARSTGSEQGFEFLYPFRMLCRHIVLFVWVLGDIVEFRFTLLPADQLPVSRPDGGTAGEFPVEGPCMLLVVRIASVFDHEVGVGFGNAHIIVGGQGLVPLFSLLGIQWRRKEGFVTRLSE